MTVPCRACAVRLICFSVLGKMQKSAYLVVSLASCLRFGRKPRRQKEILMKQGIHPDYVDCTVKCSCGNTFQTRSTKPDLKIDICNACHPFFTGQQKFVDTGGRVQRFSDRFGSAKDTVAAREAARKAERAAVAEAVELKKKEEREAKAAEKAARAAKFAAKEEKKAATEAAATTDAAVIDAAAEEVVAEIAAAPAAEEATSEAPVDAAE